MGSDIVYNDDELVNPDWMDKDFFEMVLRKSEEDNSLKVKTKIPLNLQLF